MIDFDITEEEAIVIAERYGLCDDVKEELEKGVLPFDALCSWGIFEEYPKNRKVIICLVGKSGVGKTLASTMFKFLFDWNVVCSYTTRNMRDDEINGVDHIFVGKDDVPDKSEMLAYTLFGDNEYWTLYNQFEKNIPNVYVIDEKGIEWLKEKVSDFELILIKVKRENLDSISDERKARDNDRKEFPDDYYDYIINNDGNINELQSTVYLIGCSIKQRM